MYFIFAVYQIEIGARRRLGIEAGDAQAVDGALLDGPQVEGLAVCGDDGGASQVDEKRAVADVDGPVRAAHRVAGARRLHTHGAEDVDALLVVD